MKTSILIGTPARYEDGLMQSSEERLTVSRIENGLVVTAENISDEDTDGASVWLDQAQIIQLRDFLNHHYGE